MENWQRLKDISEIEEEPKLKTVHNLEKNNKLSIGVLVLILLIGGCIGFSYYKQYQEDDILYRKNLNHRLKLYKDSILPAERRAWHERAKRERDSIDNAQALEKNTKSYAKPEDVVVDFDYEYSCYKRRYWDSNNTQWEEDCNHEYRFVFIKEKKELIVYLNKVEYATYKDPHFYGYKRDNLGGYMVSLKRRGASSQLLDKYRDETSIERITCDNMIILSSGDGNRYTYSPRIGNNDVFVINRIY